MFNVDAAERTDEVQTSEPLDFIPILGFNPPSFGNVENIRILRLSMPQHWRI